MRRRVIGRHRDVRPLARRGIGLACDAQVVVGEIILCAILIVVARDLVESHRNRQLRQLGLGLDLLGPLDDGLDPPSIIDVRLLHHGKSLRRVATARQIL